MKKKLTIIFCFLFSFIIFAQTDTADIGYILFKGDLSEYKDSSLTNRLLDEYSDKINQLQEENNAANIYIHGYTAIFPNGIDAMNLSQSRADKIKNELISRGVDKKFFAEVQGRGNTDIWGNNATDIARQPNRRVVISIEYDAKRIEDTTQAVNAGVKKKIKADSISKSDESFSINWWIILWILLVILIVILVVLLIKGTVPALVRIMFKLETMLLRKSPKFIKLFHRDFWGKKFVMNPFDSQGKQKPNVYYPLNEQERMEINTYFGATDALGRISTTFAHDLKLKNRVKKLSMNKSKLPEQLPTDDRGHLIGDNLCGTSDRRNLSPMDWRTNRDRSTEGYPEIERDIADSIRKGKSCSLKTDPIYEGDSSRPKEYKVEWTIDGVKNYKTISNSNII